MLNIKKIENFLLIKPICILKFKNLDFDYIFCFLEVLFLVAKRTNEIHTCLNLKKNLLRFEFFFYIFMIYATDLGQKSIDSWMNVYFRVSIDDISTIQTVSQQQKVFINRRTSAENLTFSTCRFGDSYGKNSNSDCARI